MQSNLFNVEEVSGLKSDSVAWDGDIVIVGWSVREVATHGKRHGFVLQTQEFSKRINNRRQGFNIDFEQVFLVNGIINLINQIHYIE